ncbi:MAG: thioredoxin family protein [Bacteroidota bacterium]|nr:thioredoxin family protein [Bacteroidota bacterium]
MPRTLLILLFISLWNLNAQENEKILFSEAINSTINTYNSRVDAALESGEFDYAKSLFDSLVKDHLQGSYIDALEFERFNSGIASTEEFDKPTILLTYASWCIPSEGEIPVLNKMVERYSDLVDFVVLFWDSKDTVRRLAKSFDKNIHIVYVDETKNKHMQTVNLLKHALGLSLSFVMGADGEILDINRRPPNKMNLSESQLFNQNITFLSRQIAAINIDHNININELPESLATF